MKRGPTIAGALVAPVPKEVWNACKKYLDAVQKEAWEPEVEDAVQLFVERREFTPTTTRKELMGFLRDLNAIAGKLEERCRASGDVERASLYAAERRMNIAPGSLIPHAANVAHDLARAARSALDTQRSMPSEGGRAGRPELLALDDAMTAIYGVFRSSGPLRLVLFQNAIRAALGEPQVTRPRPDRAGSKRI